jgi:hypothetical protein
MWVTVLYVVLMFSIPASLFRIPKLLALCLFALRYVQNTRFMLLFFSWLSYSLYVLLSILCVLCFCIVLCTVSPYVYSCFFPIYVQYRHQCHRVKTQLQLISITSYDIITWSTSLLWCPLCFILSQMYVVWCGVVWCSVLIKKICLLYGKEFSFHIITLLSNNNLTYHTAVQILRTVV